MSDIVWLLDLDGVLNFFGPSPWPSVLTFSAGFKSVRFRIRYSPELVAAIRSTADDCEIDLRLASTWCEEPRAILTGFGLDIPNAFTVAPDDNVPRLKQQAALDVVRSGSRLVWTDDDAIPSAGPELDELRAAGALLIVPDETRGLTPGHLEQVRAWAGSQ